MAKTLYSRAFVVYTLHKYSSCLKWDCVSSACKSNLHWQCHCLNNKTFVYNILHVFSLFKLFDIENIITHVPLFFPCLFLLHRCHMKWTYIKFFSAATTCFLLLSFQMVFTLFRLMSNVDMSICQCNCFRIEHTNILTWWCTLNEKTKLFLSVLHFTLLLLVVGVFSKTIEFIVPFGIDCSLCFLFRTQQLRERIEQCHKAIAQIGQYESGKI